MRTEFPLVSIVIANFNFGRFLAAAIESVLNQSCQDFELIIVDGGSSDNSVEIIKQYEERIAWWCSEPDRGQSHAFNKGFAQARGRFLTWLNADDILLPGTLEKLAKSVKRYPRCRWFAGNLIRYDTKGKIMAANWGPNSLPSWMQRANSPIVTFGPTSFFESELYHELGGMDERLYYIMDTDLWLRFMQHGVKLHRLNYACWGFRMHAASKTAEFGEHALGERERYKMRAETRMVYDKTGYKCSSLWRFVQLVWRTFDGSLIYSCYRNRLWRYCIASNSALATE